MNSIAERFEAFERRAPLRTRRFGVRPSAVVELAIFFAIALLADFLIFDGDRFQSLSPHPFWIPVILLSVQYGSTEGLLAALAATAALLLGALPEQTFGQDIFDYLASITKRPILWFAAAIVVGEFAARRRRRLERTERALLEVREEADGLADAYADARKSKDRLEARLAGELRTTLALYEGARAVERSSVGDVLRGSTELVRGVLGPEKFSIFLLNDDVLEAAVQEGWTQNDLYGRRFEADDPLAVAVMTEGRSLCAAYRDDAALLGEEGLLAAPLAGGPTGRPVGMLKVEALSFAELTTSTIEHFRLATEWIGAALERANRQEALAAGQVTAAGGETLSAVLYAHEATLMTKLGDRFGFECAQLLIDVEAAHRMSPDEQKAFARALAAASGEALRDTDLTFDLGRRGGRYAILLPGADVEAAAPVAARLEAELRRLAPAAATTGEVSVRVEALADAR